MIPRAAEVFPALFSETRAAQRRPSPGRWRWGRPPLGASAGPGGGGRNPREAPPLAHGGAGLALSAGRAAAAARAAAGPAPMALSSRLLLAARGLRAAGKGSAPRAGLSRRRLRGPRAPGSVRRPGVLAVLLSQG